MLPLFQDDMGRAYFNIRGSGTTISPFSTHRPLYDEFMYFGHLRHTYTLSADDDRRTAAPATGPGRRRLYFTSDAITLKIFRT